MRCKLRVNVSFALPFVSCLIKVFFTQLIFALKGRKSRDVEIMYPAQPTAIATTEDGYLLVYSETHIDVFDAQVGEPFF